MSDVVVGSTDVPPPPPGMPLYPPPGYSSTPYAGAYPYYPPPPPPPKAASGSGFPPWVWVALGVVLAGLGGKLLEGAKSKQADLQQAMMQQMLKFLNNIKHWQENIILIKILVMKQLLKNYRK